MEKQSYSLSLFLSLASLRTPGSEWAGKSVLTKGCQACSQSCAHPGREGAGGAPPSLTLHSWDFTAQLSEAVLGDLLLLLNLPVFLFPSLDLYLLTLYPSNTSTLLIFSRQPLPPCDNNLTSGPKTSGEGQLGCVRHSQNASDFPPLQLQVPERENGGEAGNFLSVPRFPLPNF